MKRWLSLFIYLFLTSSLLSFAQSTLERNIVDSFDAVPIAYSSITHHEETVNKIINAAVTDRKGAFKLKSTRIEKYYPSIDFLGYETGRRNNILAAANKNISIGNVQLSPVSRLIETAELIGYRSLSLQWQNSDLDVLHANEQRITANSENSTHPQTTSKKRMYFV